MTLAGRLTLGFAALAVVVAAVIGGLSYAATDHSLDNQIRSTLGDAATTLAAGEVPDGLSPEPSRPDGDADSDDAKGDDAPAGRHGAGPARPPRLLAQLLSADGTATGTDGLPARLPVDAGDLQVARSATDHQLSFREIRIDGARYLMLTRSLGHGGGAVQVARSRQDATDVLTLLAGSIAVLALLVAAAAAVAGRFLAAALTRRLVRLTAIAEQVGATGRLDVEVPTRGRDEVGRLGVAFDSMLGRLARSKDDQQRLVQNAGHELRTPLTSIRTNVSLLRRADELPPQERSAVLDDLAGEARELTELVNELVELATDRRADEPPSDVDLVDVATRVAERARRRSGRPVEVLPEPAAQDPDGDPPAFAVRGRAAALERAVTNLVDNAIKFDRGGTEPIEIVLRTVPEGIRLEVRDRGPGVPAEDLDRVFDRFHRATSVRSMPGSGLGLSIVRDVVTDHIGTVFATHRDGGGAVIGFTLPAQRFPPGSNPG